MKKQKHLSWDNFLSTIFIQGQQRVHRISRSPQIEVFGDGINDRIGIWLELTGNANIPEQASRLASVSINRVTRGEKSFLEIVSLSSAINRQFYLFVIAVADRILESNQIASEAVALELESFAALLQEKLFLSIERQLGLLGELLVLDRMIATDGPKATKAWIGPRGEPHDFRVGNHEFEVKSTSGTRRIHTINNLTQLAASPDCSLFILSVLLGPAGKDSGFSLAMKVEATQLLLKDSHDCGKLFMDNLELAGYSSRDHSQYTRAFDLRRPLALIPVDSNFPVITGQTLKNAIGEIAHRIDHFEYDVNVEGLESEEGTELYSTMFPWPKA